MFGIVVISADGISVTVSVGVVWSPSGIGLSLCCRVSSWAYGA